MHTMACRSVAVKIGFRHLTRDVVMFSSNSESAIPDCKHISTCQPGRLLSGLMEDLCTMTTWHEHRSDTVPLLCSVVFLKTALLDAFFPPAVDTRMKS